MPASPALRAPGSAAQGGRSFFLDSPALSQISTLSDGNLSNIGGGGGGAVNRRLFGTPFHGGSSRFASTPLHGTAGPSTAVAAAAQRPATIVEQDADEDGGMRCHAAAAVECPATRKRRLEDLFGDIGDIADDNDDGPDANRDRLYNAMAKRARTEAEIDLDMIEAILERRKQRLLAAAATGGSGGRCGGVALQAERLEALHRFKRQNLSYVRPQWPYTTLRRCGAANSVLDRERVYVRMHSEQFENDRIEEVVGCGADARRANGVLGAARAETWAKAQKIVSVHWVLG